MNEANALLYLESAVWKAEEPEEAEDGVWLFLCTSLTAGRHEESVACFVFVICELRNL